MFGGWVCRDLNVPMVVLGLALLVAAMGWRRLTGGAVGGVAVRMLLGLVGLGVVGLALWWCATPDKPPPEPPRPPLGFEECKKLLQASVVVPPLPPGVKAGAATMTSAEASTPLAFRPAAAQGSGAAASAPDMGLVSGPRTGTYYAMGDNIIDLAGRAGLRMLNIDTNGTLENLRKMAGRDNAAIGFAQADILEVLLNSNDSEQRKQAALLRRVLTLYLEEVHVLARANLNGVADLAGKRVLVANDSEGSLHTARNLLRHADVTPAVLDNTLSAVDAVCQVVTGQADAMVIVAGKPTPLLVGLDALLDHQTRALAQVRLLPLASVPASPSYETTHIHSNDYKWLAQSATPQDSATETRGVRAVLMAYDFSKRLTPYQHLRCDQLSQLTRMIKAELPALQREPNHKKWQQVDLQRRLGDWKDNACL